MGKSLVSCFLTHSVVLLYNILVVTVIIAIIYYDFLAN